jgi:hypothetical protein
LAATPAGSCEHLEPRIGHSGKDVMWVPTNDALVKAMLEAAGTNRNDYVIDLGAGDGKIPIAAARDFGARALGIEYDEQLVKLAQCKVRAAGVADKVEIRRADLFETDFSEASVLTLYLLSDLNMRLRPRILKMRPGTRVVSNTFRMGDWEPDQTITTEASAATAFLWIVPAQVQGTWTFVSQDGSDRFRVQIAQRFQKIEGTLLGSARSATVRDARLSGERIELTIVGHAPERLKLSGTVRGDKIDATVERDGKKLRYTGTRGRARQTDAF